MRVAFGYFKKHFLMSDPEIAARRRAIVDCAGANDCALVAIFIDELETAPEQLHKALRALMEADDVVLILPNLLHLAAAGNPLQLRQHLLASHVEVLLSEVPKQAGRTC
ncbi:hypothetical protein ACFWUU_15920 [Kribbella sp. NPDC058693]|uniref:hypothetical protein n=1 Tax=Kribbella sp. NPDC058693 TaxID=3346602 RepID=UPI00365E5F72